jgi:hypothetical protein
MAHMKNQKTEFIRDTLLARLAGVHVNEIERLMQLGVIEHDAAATDLKGTHSMFLRERVKTLVAIIKKHQDGVQEEVTA